MAEVSIEKLASDISTTVDRLLKQFKDAGIEKNINDSVTEEEKQKLLSFLNKQHGGEGTQAPKKMTLLRKTTSTISLGKSRAVKVEVRKKRTYVKRSDVELQQQAEEEAKRKAEEDQARLEAERVAAEAAKAAAEEKAKRQTKRVKSKKLNVLLVQKKLRKKLKKENQAILN